MSYHTWAYLQYDEFDAKLDIEDFIPELMVELDQSGIHQDALNDLRRLFISQEATFNLDSLSLSNLLRWIACRRPNIAFGVQGRGEEVRDVWIRQYSDGDEIFSQGPFVE